MNEKLQTSTEAVMQTSTPQETADKKPGFFTRAFNKVTRGITSLVTGVDKVVSHIPVVGEVYGVAKWVVREVWRVTDHVPFLRDVNAGIRKHARAIHEKAWFTKTEKKEISKEEDKLLAGLQEIRDNIARDMPESQMKTDLIACYDALISDPSPEKARSLLDNISQKYPQLKPIIEQYFQGDGKNKTGKEKMTASQLIEEWKQLDQKMMDTFGKEKDAKPKKDFTKEEFEIFKKTFPDMPDFASLEKSSPMYKFLQNAYFAREPRPDLSNPLVQEFMRKTYVLMQGDLWNDKFSTLFQERNSFVVSNKQALVDAFHLSDFEQSCLERNLNYRERRRRTDLMPEGYAGPTYGVDRLEATLYERLFPVSANWAMDDFWKKFDTYEWTCLDFFVGGGH